MGAIGSKSPLERRNTVARRSQRRTLHNMKPKIDNVYKDIKKFKGITEDTNYVALKNEIEYLKNDLIRRGKDLQPQVRNIYENVYKRISEAEEALENKLEENKEKSEKKEAKQNGSVINSVADDIASNAGEQESEIEISEEQKEALELENSKEKRKTVEITLVQVIPEEDEKPAKEVRIISPAEKRKSILKVGVPVMPGAIMNEFAAQSTRITRQYDTHDATSPTTVQDILSRVNAIVESLRQIEVEISDFVGKKHGKQYNKIRDVLNRYLIELNSLNTADEYAVDQLKICRSYVGSCLTFLDERASDDGKRESFTSDDEVFENNNVSLTKVEDNFRLQKLLKNTPV